MLAPVLGTVEAACQATADLVAVLQWHARPVWVQQCGLFLIFPPVVAYMHLPAVDCAGQAVHVFVCKALLHIGWVCTDATTPYAKHFTQHYSVTE
jgi:hypothetical protein